MASGSGHCSPRTLHTPLLARYSHCPLLGSPPCHTLVNCLFTTLLQIHQLECAICLRLGPGQRAGAVGLYGPPLRPSPQFCNGITAMLPHSGMLRDSSEVTQLGFVTPGIQSIGLPSQLRPCSLPMGFPRPHGDLSEAP